MPYPVLPSMVKGVLKDLTSEAERHASQAKSIRGQTKHPKKQERASWGSFSFKRCLLCLHIRLKEAAIHNSTYVQLFVPFINQNQKKDDIQTPPRLRVAGGHKDTVDTLSTLIGDVMIFLNNH